MTDFLLYGFIICFSILFLFVFLFSYRKFSKGLKIFFLTSYCLFCALLYISYVDFFVFVLLLSSFVFGFRDVFERQIYILPSILLFSLAIFFYKIPFPTVLAALSLFFLFWLFCHFTKEKFIGIGDFYFIFPFSLYLFATNTELVPHFLFESTFFYNLSNLFAITIMILFYASLLSIIYYLPHRKNEFFSIPLVIPILFASLLIIHFNVLTFLLAISLVILISLFEKSIFSSVKKHN